MKKIQVKACIYENTYYHMKYMSKPKPLTDRDNAYIDAFVATRDRAKAAKLVGLGPKNPVSCAIQLEKRAVVRQALDERLAVADAAAEANAGVSIEYVLKLLKSLAERCMQVEPVLDAEGNPIGVFKFDSAGANGALRSLLQHFSQQADRKAGHVPATFQLFMAGTNQQVNVLAARTAELERD